MKYEKVLNPNYTLCNLLGTLLKSWALSTSSQANLVSQNSAWIKLFSVVNWGQKTLRICRWSEAMCVRWQWLNVETSKHKNPPKIIVCFHLICVFSRFLFPAMAYMLWAETCGGEIYCTINHVLVMQFKSRSINHIISTSECCCDEWFSFFSWDWATLISCRIPPSPFCSPRCLTMWWAPWEVREGCQSSWCQGDASVWRCIAEQSSI